MAGVTEVTDGTPSYLHHTIRQALRSFLTASNSSEQTADAFKRMLCTHPSLSSAHVRVLVSSAAITSENDRDKWWITMAPEAISCGSNLADADVTEVRDGTPGAQHTAIQLVIKCLLTLDSGHCTAANVAAMIQAHPTFSGKHVQVVLVSAPVSAVSVSGTVNIQRVSGLGDFIISYLP
ncbi:hypothetical protein Pelo_16611 [Pelomyxa schiedti]|nr:hypothetical protein Pelo_16611 [Pelomyxa schiedti]